jgi:hypothetical protein
LRGLRGGSFGDGDFSLHASYRNGEAPSFDYANYGFRVSQILAPTALPHAGDANNDGAVDVVDLGILAANYDGTGKTWAQGDFSGDGHVDVVDLGILAKNYDWAGTTAGAVPEPATMILLALGGLAMIRRRRK